MFPSGGVVCGMLSGELQVGHARGIRASDAAVQRSPSHVWHHKVRAHQSTAADWCQQAAD